MALLWRCWVQKSKGGDASSSASATGTYCGRPPLDQARSSPHPEPTPPAVAAARCARNTVRGPGLGPALDLELLVLGSTENALQDPHRANAPRGGLPLQAQQIFQPPKHAAVLELRREVAAQRVLTAADRDRDCRLRKSGSDQQRDLVALPSRRDERPSTPLRWPVRFREFLHFPLQNRGLDPKISVAQNKICA